MKQKGLRKFIREDIGILIFLTIISINLYFALNNTLQPLVNSLTFIGHTLIFFFIDFNENNIHPFFHFNRGYEGSLIIATPFSFFAYIITWFLEGMDNFASQRAEISLLYTYLILLWFMFGITNIFGFVFLYIMIFKWHPMILRNFIPAFQTQPLILIPELILLIIFSMFGYFSHVSLLWGSIKKKDNFGKNQKKFKKFGYLTLVFNLIVFVILMLYHEKINESIVLVLNSL